MRKKPIAVVLILMMLVLCSCGQAAPQKHSAVFYDLFDTAIMLIAYTDTTEAFDAAAALAEARFAELDHLFDQYHGYDGLTNLYTLNQGAAVSPMTVPQELMELLLWCKEMQPKTAHSVNIAMGGVLSLWHDCRQSTLADPQTAAVPSREALVGAAAHQNIDDLILDEESSTVFFADPALKLDLGAIAKGYATEKVAQVLEESGLTSFILNAGGNVRVGAAPLDGRASWSVGLQDPDATQDQYFAVLNVNQLAVVTSGDYQRFFWLDGVRYAHIISPETLEPAREHRSVSVICPSSTLADWLSTALFILPQTQGEQLLSAFPDTEAVWITAEGDMVYSSGAKALLRAE